MKNKDFLNKLTLQESRWRDSYTHTYCQICKVMITVKSLDYPDAISEAYISINDDYGFWICKSCFEKYKEKYQWKVIEVSDLRLTNQENYLKDKKLIYARWNMLEGSIYDHDHCEFCWVKFTDIDEIEDSVEKGYCTKDRYHWICEKGFEDFKGKFNWKVD